jgi:hypothetical protein
VEVNWTLSEGDVAPQFEETDGDQHEEVTIRVHWQGQEHQVRMPVCAGKARSEYQIKRELQVGPDPVAFRYSRFHTGTWCQGEYVWLEQTVTIRVRHTNTAATTTLQIPKQAHGAEVHKQARLALALTEAQRTRMKRQNPEGAEWQKYEGVELDDEVPDVPFTIEWRNRRKQGAMPAGRHLRPRQGVNLTSRPRCS